MKDPYFLRPETSNSDLSALDKYFKPASAIVDLEKAYRFGTLVHCLILEPEKVNMFDRTCEGNTYTHEEIRTAEGMLQAFMRHPFCSQALAVCVKEEPTIAVRFGISYNGFIFYMAVRIKLDLYNEAIKFGADIKSTQCKTQKEFEQSILYFDYDQQAAWYMDIKGIDSMMIIGLSIFGDVFLVPIKRDSEFFRTGQLKYQEKAFMWWSLFEHWPERTTLDKQNLINNDKNQNENQEGISIRQFI